nr:copia protein [Tanacetum cinerariifolium]
MELESTQTSTTAKLPMLKQGDYEMWRLRIKQYLQYKDAKTLFAAIETRFSENEATKKTQKILLKQLPSSTNEVSTTYGVSTASTQSSTASIKVSTANLSDAIVQPKNQDSRSWNQDSSKRTVNVEETPPKAMVSIDGVGFDWSYMAEDEVPTNMALMAFLDSESGLEEFQQTKFESYGPKSCKIESKNPSENTPNELKESTKVKESYDVSLVKKLVSDDKLEKKIVVPTYAKIEFIKAKQQEKPVRKPVKPRPVNTARPNSSVVNVVRANQVNVVKASASTKDETSGILKKFVTEIEILVDKKVKAEAVNTACYVHDRDDNGVNIDSGINAHEKSANSINDVNIFGPSINTASTDFDIEGDMSNINTTYQVPSTLNTRIHKDHSLDLVIGDVQSGVFRNKKEERGIVIKNKAQLVAQGYTQEKGIDCDEFFAPLARIEAIRLFLADASFMGFMVYQMECEE